MTMGAKAQKPVERGLQGSGILVWLAGQSAKMVEVTVQRHQEETEDKDSSSKSLVKNTALKLMFQEREAPQGDWLL